jgi:hypothetical protein
MRRDTQAMARNTPQSNPSSEPSEWRSAKLRRAVWRATDADSNPLIPVLAREVIEHLVDGRFLQPM